MEKRCSCAVRPAETACSGIDRKIGSRRGGGSASSNDSVHSSWWLLGRGPPRRNGGGARTRGWAQGAATVLSPGQGGGTRARRISGQRTGDGGQTRFTVTNCGPHPPGVQPSPPVIELSLSFDFEETHQSVVSGSLKRAEKLLSIRGYNRNNLISLIRLRVISQLSSNQLPPASPLALLSTTHEGELRDDAVYYSPCPAIVRDFVGGKRKLGPEGRAV